MSKKKQKKLKQAKIKESKNRQMKKKRRKNGNTLLLVTLTMFALISVGTIGGVILLCITSQGVPVQEVEATLLASGLSIIGMAISVWTGLNIVNAIEKKDVEQVQQQLAQTEQTIKWISRETRDVKIIEKEQKEIYRGLFLQELLRTNHDAMSRYFYDLFAKNGFLSIEEYSHYSV